MVLHNGIAQWYCTMVLHNGIAQWYCTTVLHNGTAQRYCTTVLHNGTAQRYCTTVLHNGTAQRHCTMVLHNLFPICKKVFYLPFPSANSPASNILYLKEELRHNLKRSRQRQGAVTARQEAQRGRYSVQSVFLLP